MLQASPVESGVEPRLNMTPVSMSFNYFPEDQLNRLGAV